MSMQDLPDEVLERVFGFCDGVSLKASNCTCAQWAAVIGNGERYWQPLADSYYQSLCSIIESGENGTFAVTPPDRAFESLLHPSDAIKQDDKPQAPWRNFYTLLASCSFIRCENWNRECHVETRLRQIMIQHGSHFVNRVFNSLGDMLESLPSIQHTYFKYRSMACLLPFSQRKMVFPVPPLNAKLLISHPLHLFGPRTIEGGSQARLEGQIHVDMKSPGVFSATNVDIISPTTATTDTITVSGENSVARFTDCSIEQEFPDGKTPRRVIAESGGRILLDRSVIHDTIEIKEKSDVQITESSIWSRRGSISLRKDAGLSISRSIFISGNEIINLTLPFNRLDIDGCSHRRIFFQNKILSTMDCERLIQQLRISCEDLERSRKREAEGRDGPPSPALLARVSGCIKTLSNLARESNDVEKWMASVGCLGIVLGAMKCAPEERTIQEASCAFMWIFASTETNKRSMASLELADCVVGALTKFGAAHAILAEAGLSTLANLCISRPGGRYDAKPLRAHLGSDTFISLLLKLLSAHRATKTITDSVLYLLWGISLEGDATPRDRVFALGGLELFLELLRTGKEHAGLRPMICGSLSSVIITSANRKSFVDNGGLEVMAQLLEDSNAGLVPDGEEPQELLTERFKDLGILAQLIKICNLADQEDVRTKENAVAALANFASCSEENKIILRDAGGLKPLLHLLKMVDPSDESLASVKMAVIIAISHMSSQVELSPGDLHEIEAYWTVRKDLQDVIFSPNDVKFVLHTREAAIKMMALWCMAYILLEEPPVGNELNWKTVAEKLEPFINECRSQGKQLPQRQKEIINLALEKLRSFKVTIKPIAK